MSEYIKREDVLQILSGKNAAWDAYQKIELLPAADVVERKKGKWIEKEGYYYCSNCEELAYFDCEDEPILSKFCQDCGAEMEIDDDEEWLKPNWNIDYMHTPSTEDIIKAMESDG